LAPLPLAAFRYFRQESRKVYDDGTIQVDNSYYGAAPAPLHTRVVVRIYDEEIEILDPQRMEIIRRHPKSKLILGICNGFQALVNLGLLPGFDGDYRSRRIAVTYNDSGNFVDTWVKLKIKEDTVCAFTKGISTVELPVRHGEGKFYAETGTIERLVEANQVVARYADEQGNPALGRWPFNPNGSLYDIAGICDATGRIFGVMPHPEAFNHYTNHPDWVMRREELARVGKRIEKEEGEGIAIFRNAVQYVREYLDW